MDILPVMEFGSIPEAPPGYTPSPWALRVDAALDWVRKQKNVKAVLVHLEEDPRIRYVGQSVEIG